MQGEWEDALDAFEDASGVVAQEGLHHLMHAQAVTIINMGGWTEAIPLLDHAVFLQPVSGGVRLLRALVWVALNQESRSSEDLAQVTAVPI